MVAVILVSDSSWPENVNNVPNIHLLALYGCSIFMQKKYFLGLNLSSSEQAVFVHSFPVKSRKKVGSVPV